MYESSVHLESATLAEVPLRTQTQKVFFDFIIVTNCFPYCHVFFPPRFRFVQILATSRQTRGLLSIHFSMEDGVERTLLRVTCHKRRLNIFLKYVQLFRSTNPLIHQYLTPANQVNDDTWEIQLLGKRTIDIAIAFMFSYLNITFGFAFLSNSPYFSISLLFNKRGLLLRTHFPFLFKYHSCTWITPSLYSLWVCPQSKSYVFP